MRRRVYPLVLAGMTVAVPLIGSAAPSPADSGPPGSTAPADPHAVRLSIDTAAMGGEAQSTAEWVQRDGSAALAEAGAQVTAEADTEVRVIIAPEGLGYTVTLEVRERGAEAPSLTRGPKVCETCTRTELVGLVGRELAWVGGWLASSPDSEESSPGESATAVDSTEGGAADAPEAALDTDEPPPRRLRALGWAGVGVGALGLGTFIGGLVIGPRDYQARGEPGDYRSPLVDRPKLAGWLMVGAGAAAMVGGTVMVVLDLREHRRRPLTAGPWLDHRTAGLWLRRRF